MSIPLVEITRWQCANLSGIRTLWLVVPEDVQDLPESLAVPNVDRGLTLNDGAQLYKVEFDRRTGGHQESLKTNTQGDYYERTVSFDVRRLRVNVADLRRRLMNRRVHVVFTDHNGSTFLYTWMALRSAVANGAATGNNGTRFEFRGASSRVAPFVEAEILDTPGVTEDGILLLQPSTGNKFRLTIGDCDELITVPVTTDDPTTDVTIRNYTVSLNPDDELTTEAPD